MNHLSAEDSSLPKESLHGSDLLALMSEGFLIHPSILCAALQNLSSRKARKGHGDPPLSLFAWFSVVFLCFLHNLCISSAFEGILQVFLNYLSFCRYLLLCAWPILCLVRFTPCFVLSCVPAAFLPGCFCFFGMSTVELDWYLTLLPWA